MKKYAGLLIIAVLLSMAVACSKDYSTKIIGKWNAGIASEKSEIIVTFKSDGTLSALLTNMNTKPVNGTYIIKDDKLDIEFANSKTKLNYTIYEIDGTSATVKSQYAKVVWKRLE